jgi:hypothetical protein
MTAYNPAKLTLTKLLMAPNLEAALKSALTRNLLEDSEMFAWLYEAKLSPIEYVFEDDRFQMFDPNYPDDPDYKIEDVDKLYAYFLPILQALKKDHPVIAINDKKDPIVDVKQDLKSLSISGEKPVFPKALSKYKLLDTKVGEGNFSEVVEAVPIQRYVSKIVPKLKDSIPNACLSNREMCEREFTIATLMGKLGVGPVVVEAAIGDETGMLVMERYDDNLQNLIDTKAIEGSVKDAYDTRIRELIKITLT